MMPKEMINIDNQVLLLYKKELSDYLLQQENKLITIEIDLTLSCNHLCPNCTFSNSRKKRIFIDRSILNKILIGLPKTGVKGMIITGGGEPCLHKELGSFVKQVYKLGIDVTLTTNGQFLGEMATDLKRAGLRRVNISLDSLNPDNFRKLTHRGELCRTLTGIKAAIKSGLSPIKLNTVVIKNRNDHEVIDIAEYGIANHCQVRFLELMPIGITDAHFHDWFVSSAEVMKRLMKRFELRPVTQQSGGSSRNYSVCDSKGRIGIIGFISPYTSPFCSGCRRLRLTADGKLLGCLALNCGYEIRSLLQCKYSSGVVPLIKVVNSALSIKHKSRLFDSCEAMVKIGG